MLAVCDKAVSDAGFELVVKHYSDGSGMKLTIQPPDEFVVLGTMSHGYRVHTPQQTIEAVRQELARITAQQ